MTDKEVIKLTQGFIIKFKSDTMVDFCNTVLEKFEKEPCEDCISRQALIEKATSWDKHFADSERCVSLTDIQNAPPVTPQPKRGKWISHREHCENLGVMASGLGAYEWCSNCDCGIDVKEFHRNYYNFCPNCGADMREVQDECKTESKEAEERA